MRGALSLCVAALATVASPARAEPIAPLIEGPAMAVGVAFEPRLGSFGALDNDLESYGFAPVSSPYLNAWGLRGRAAFSSGVFLRFDMTYGFGLNSDAISPAPTTTSLIDTGAGVGLWGRAGWLLSLGGGFAVMTHTVASDVQAGSLVYRGPTLNPRVGYTLSIGGSPSATLVATAGYVLHVPIGSAHENPLWENPFHRTAIHAFTVGVEWGLGLMRGPR